MALVFFPLLHSLYTKEYVRERDKHFKKVVILLKITFIKKMYFSIFLFHIRNFFVCANKDSIVAGFFSNIRRTDARRTLGKTHKKDKAFLRREKKTIHTRKPGNTCKGRGLVLSKAKDAKHDQKRSASSIHKYDGAAPLLQGMSERKPSFAEHNNL